MSEDKLFKIDKTKGRPMLHWVGKKPIDVVQSYPAQLIETVNGVKTTPTYDALEKDWQNLLFHGDNKEVLSTLIVNGFRGKVDLIYIDPPFDSGADYVRKIELRGSKQRVEGEEQSILEQTQYTDIWANDNYLQFIYERLVLLRELLSEDGTIYLHCDWHKSHQLRFLLDEVFGANNFLNEIIWQKVRATKRQAAAFGNVHDSIFSYKKSDKYKFEKLYVEHDEARLKSHYNNLDEDNRRFQLADFTQTGAGPSRVFGARGMIAPPSGKHWIWSQGKIDEGLDKGLIVFTDSGKPRVKRFLDESEGNPMGDIWTDIYPLNSQAKDATGYPTQKPVELLERLLGASSAEGSIILDCFMGSGTTAVAAQKLGRRWIGVDINKGAVQTTMKRLQKVVTTQQKSKIETKPASDRILHYRVNNYDFQKIHELKGIIIEKYDVTPTKTDNYFDGIVGEQLVKIAQLNQPVNKLAVQGILNELANRSNETRNILVIGSGIELGVDEMLATHNKTHPVNKIEVRDVHSDGIIVFEPAEADVSIEKKNGKVTISIGDYLSPTILKRLDIDRSIFGEKISDFRSQIDVVVVDTNYDGKTFNITFSDVPEKKSDFIIGEYELELSKDSEKVAVKIIDMLGEETLCVK